MRAPPAILLTWTVIGAACPGWWGATDLEGGALSAGSTTQPCVTGCDATSLAPPTSSADPTAADVTSVTTGTATTDTPLPGSTSSSTTAPDVSSSSSETGPPPPPTIDDAWCDLLDPNQVYLSGTYQQAASYRDAIARLAFPRVGCVGFEDYAWDFVIRPSDGSLVWIETFDSAGIRVFARDEQIWDDDLWLYPEDPYANDTVLPTVACAQKEPGDDNGPRHFLVHPGDGSILYNCSSDPSPRPYYNLDGDVVLESIQQFPLALGFDGSVVAIGADKDAASLQLVPPGGVTIDVTGPPGTAKVLGIRAHPQGFWIASRIDAGAPVERWSIDAAGDGTLDGEYAAGQYGQAESYIDVKFTGDGDAVYFQHVFDGGFEVVVHARLAPGRSDIVYSEQGVPDASWPTDPAPFVYSKQLFTGP